MEDAGENNDAGNYTPTDMMYIRSDYRLDGFSRLTEAKLVKILVILHSGAGRVNNPSSTEVNKETYCFKVGRFNGPEYYLNVVEDSDC